MATSTTPTPNSGAAEDILVFAVGKYRTTVERMGPVFRGTPFRFVGILDTASSPEPYTFTPDRLRLALRVLYPRPRCFVAGEAIEAGQNAAAVEVWREFVDETDIENPLLINVCTPLPPPFWSTLKSMRHLIVLSSSHVDGCIASSMVHLADINSYVKTPKGGAWKRSQRYPRSS